jgi:hypothetical protein
LFLFPCWLDARWAKKSISFIIKNIDILQEEIIF